MRYLLVTLTLFLFISISIAEAQRGINYQTLLMSAEQPNAYIAPLVIPVSDDEALMGVAFRLEYDFIPFTRIRNDANRPFPEAQYSSRVQMGLDVYTGSFRESRRSGREVRGSSVFRDTFIDTVFVSTFEETKSSGDHLQGFISQKIRPGKYHYELRLTRGDTQREIPSRIRNLNVPAYSALDSAIVVLASGIESNNNGTSATLMNYGVSVLYGEDYHVLYVLPKAGKSDYTLNVHRVTGRTSIEQDPVYTTGISSDELFYAKEPVLRKNNETIRLNLSPGNNEDILFASVRIPNSNFKNSPYRLILKNAAGETISAKTVQSLWVDMPVSLLNLDVAIDMLRFITNSDKLRDLKSGNTAERERKFREFWAERDPSPDTEFNELMAEYYYRIDYAYENFTSMQQPGYETDQGMAYILYGEPENVDRRLRTDGPTREIWEYPNRTLIFEATTGFGDFRLISEQ